MHPFLRLLHVLAVSLWFGSVAFFTLAGLLIFQAFQEVSSREGDARPLWLPLPQAFAQPAPEGFPDPLRLEQGSRAAGTAVGKIFPVYYALQTGCGIVALLTAWLLARSGEGHRLRMLLSLLALLTAVGGWWLERRVEELRIPRNELTDRVLTASAPSDELLAEARQARSAFGRWHGFSLMQNFVTLLLAGGLTLLLPGPSPGTSGIIHRSRT